MTTKKKLLLQLSIIIAIDIVLITLCAVYPIYADIAAADKTVGACMIKRVFKIYCLTCGGTRAFGDVMRFDILSALKNNALVVLGFAYVIFLNVYAVYAFIKKKDNIILFKPMFCVYTVIILFAFLVIRNVLYYTLGFDPIGDISSLPH